MPTCLHYLTRKRPQVIIGSGYRALGLPAYGEFEHQGTTLYATAGESGWLMPLRTGEHCAWDLITLKP